MWKLFYKGILETTHPSLRCGRIFALFHFYMGVLTYLYCKHSIMTTTNYFSSIEAPKASWITRWEVLISTQPIEDLITSFWSRHSPERGFLRLHRSKGLSSEERSLFTPTKRVQPVKIHVRHHLIGNIGPMRIIFPVFADLRERNWVDWTYDLPWNQKQHSVSALWYLTRLTWTTNSVSKLLWNELDQECDWDFSLWHIQNRDFKWLQTGNTVKT